MAEAPRDFALSWTCRFTLHQLHTDLRTLLNLHDFRRHFERYNKRTLEQQRRYRLTCQSQCPMHTLPVLIAAHPGSHTKTQIRNAMNEIKRACIEYIQVQRRQCNKYNDERRSRRGEVLGF